MAAAELGASFSALQIAETTSQERIFFSRDDAKNMQDPRVLKYHKLVTLWNDVINELKFETNSASVPPEWLTRSSDFILEECGFLLDTSDDTARPPCSALCRWLALINMAIDAEQKESLRVCRQAQHYKKLAQETEVASVVQAYFLGAHIQLNIVETDVARLFVHFRRTADENCVITPYVWFTAHPLMTIEGVLSHEPVPDKDGEMLKTLAKLSGLFKMITTGAKDLWDNTVPPGPPVPFRFNAYIVTEFDVSVLLHDLITSYAAEIVVAAETIGFFFHRLKSSENVWMDVSVSSEFRAF